MAQGTRQQGLERAQAGQTLVEFAILVMLLLVLMFGIVDAARLIFAYNAVSFAAREGVRWAVVRGATSGRTATEGDIASYVQSRAVGTPVDVSVSWNPADAPQQPGSKVIVTVQNDFAPIAFPFVPYQSIRLSSTSEMVISR